MKFLYLLALIFVSSCFNNQGQNVMPNSEESKMAILKVLSDQQVAWNDGSIDEFMQGYWNSEELCFIGSSGLNKGWNQTLSNYHKSYPDKAAMGQLKFDVLELTELATACFQMIGKYTLIRENDQPSGYFSLVWKNIEGRWLIISDHTSG